MGSIRAAALVLIVIAAAFPASALGQDATAEPSIVSADAHLELLFDGAVFAEGPAVAPDGSVYFSDITNTVLTDGQAGHIWRYDPGTGETRVFRSPSGMANGIAFDCQGHMIVAEGADFGGRSVTHTDMSTGKSVILAGLYEGRTFNSPNDLVIDSEGRIYFTDPRYSGHEPVEQPVQGVYRIDPDGTVALIIRDAGKPNGIGLSPDQRTLYVASLDNGTLDFTRGGMLAYPGRMALLAYDLAPDGSAEFREVVVDFSGGVGPDGITVDADGNLYLTRPFQPFGVHVYSPQGELLATIPTPEQPANVTFGRGPSAMTLYITATTGLYRIEVERSGIQLSCE
ncbi:MAG: SMP-30/gluconolactonase/LRE family protein [Gemmatimonadetes bacterium]|nr:SMP-30/gluconolactonase/LRE family protein [Gemmatimonadota bacterium]